MRRLCATLTTLCLLLVTMTLAVPAADYETKAAAWADVTLRSLYVQDDMTLSSDINPDFKATWPTFDVNHAGNAVTSTVNMRGFALSPDGRFAYMSVLHGGGDKVRGMFVMETMTGKILAYDTRYDGGACNGALPHFSYPKGVDADTRGYVYMGYTLSASFNEAYLRVARQNEDGTLTRMSEIPVCSLGKPGDENGTKVGINGVSISERDGRVFCYVVTNYEHDRLYCFDVTDPEAPLLCKDFGKNGSMVLTTLGGYTVDEALYLDVDTDGTVYLAITATDGRGGVAVIAPDGQSCRKVMASDGVYSVELVGNFLLCGSRTGGTITVLNRQTGRQVTTLSVNDSLGERVTRMQIAGDVLFVCDAGSVIGSSNAVYAAPLSDKGQIFLDKIVEAQNRGYAEYETDAPETETTDDDTETEATGVGESEPAGDTPPETVPPETQPESSALDTEALLESITDTVVMTEIDTTVTESDAGTPPDRGGCASVAAIPCILMAGAVILLVKTKQQ